MDRVLTTLAAGVVCFALPTPAVAVVGDRTKVADDVVAPAEASGPQTSPDSPAAGRPESSSGGSAPGASGTPPPAPKEPLQPTDDEIAPKLGIETDASAKAEPTPTPPDKPKVPWIRRFRPTRNLIELGVFGGVFLADPEHDLYDPRTAPQEPLWETGPDVGLRLGYFPLRPLGVEAEFSAVPHRVRSITNDFAFVYGFRGHVIAQLPFYSVVPFILGGYGLLGVRSNILILGDDVDPAFHYGGGLKVYFHRNVGARVEVRNIVSSAEARQNSGTSHLQVLAGLAITFNRPKPKKPVVVKPVDHDRDKDGIRNEDDLCPDVPGVEPHGCPDTDGDTFRDSLDACPEVPGVGPDGCPTKDTDGDRIVDRDDDCVFRPETYNGHQDEDGCPDDLPEPLKRFSGTIDGIEFDFNKATIRPSSTALLDKAAATLKEYPGVRVRIVGHTDDVGTDAFNDELSAKRAESVKAYLVGAGVPQAQIETEGKGARAPVVPNDSEANRAKNRRIEFQIIANEPSVSKKPPEANDDSI